jgi:hypothetical protein
MSSAAWPRHRSDTTIASCAKPVRPSKRPGTPRAVPRRPRCMRHHLETWLRNARTQERTVPRFVERELRAFLDCGILAHGFLRLHCDACKLDRVVAFSCKGRGFCPSCGGRHMADTAAHLVDRVLPRVPVRQWVLSLPFGLRYRLARDRELTANTLVVDRCHVPIPLAGRGSGQAVRDGQVVPDRVMSGCRSGCRSAWSRWFMRPPRRHKTQVKSMTLGLQPLAKVGAPLQYIGGR